MRHHLHHRGSEPRPYPQSYPSKWTSSCRRPTAPLQTTPSLSPSCSFSQQRQQLLARRRLSWCQDPPKAKQTSPLTSTRVSRPTKTRNAPQPCQRGRRAFTTSVTHFPLAIPRSSPSLRPGASIDRLIDRSPPDRRSGFPTPRPVFYTQHSNSSPILPCFFLRSWGVPLHSKNAPDVYTHLATLLASVKNPFVPTGGAKCVWGSTFPK